MGRSDYVLGRRRSRGNTHAMALVSDATVESKGDSFCGLYAAQWADRVELHFQTECLDRAEHLADFERWLALLQFDDEAHAGIGQAGEVFLRETSSPSSAANSGGDLAESGAFSRWVDPGRNTRNSRTGILRRNGCVQPRNLPARE